MLLNYRLKNFRSFKDDTKISMIAGLQRTFDENLIRKNDKRVLPSAVIYGANASGKSNIIMSLAVMRNIIVFGSLNKLKDEADLLELYPFAHSQDNAPMEFEIEFENNNVQYIYAFTIQVDRFKKGNRTVVNERLQRMFGKNYHDIFVRNEQKVTISTEKKVLNLLDINKDFLGAIESRLNQSLDKAGLFLANGFKNVVSSAVADEVIQFFEEKLLVVNDFTLKRANLVFSSEELPEDDFFAWNNLLDGFVKSADFGPQDIAFRSSKNDEDNSANMKLVSIYHCEGKEVMLPADLMESRGTLKLVDFAIPFQRLFMAGGVFFLDEFDAAIHSELIKGIIALFHDKSINKNGAQLIFTTHNPIYLNNKIFRRDQILFVEKDAEVYESAVYSLADFGSEDVRNDHNYLINYFKGKYSTLPFIDFLKLFEIKGE